MAHWSWWERKTRNEDKDEGKVRVTSTNFHFRNSSFQIRNHTLKKIHFRPLRWMPVLFSGPFCGQELFYNIISPSVCYDVACVSALIIYLLLIRFHPKSHHQNKTSINHYKIVLFLFYFSTQLQRFIFYPLLNK